MQYFVRLWTGTTIAGPFSTAGEANRWRLSNRHKVALMDCYVAVRV